ncbi:permease-like cell division protein FtsX [Legionella impletisoli]|uniref:Cell division protein FtsX n=1 Tax=Legionella impletisoli TaxID=343510 RepID=A0A917JUM8_9GAMM|nr:permease-like cell division protein FtsX [Legionella impletisoli]GGI82982.1 cell division protein FtsX [Legionella impletisoli]
MLNPLRTYLAHHAQAAVSSLNALLQKPLATFMTILVIAITLALPVLLWVFTVNLEQLTSQWKQTGHISLYLTPSLSKTKQAATLSQVRAIKGVGQATLKTPEDGLEQLQQQEGMNDIMSYLSENPLPAVIEVTPAIHIDKPSEIETLYHQLKELSNVDQAKLDMQWVNRLHAILDFASNVVHGLMVLLAMAVILIIGNTLRLAIQSRHEEIQVLKLIGATDSFIVRPFLYSGLWYGLAGAVLAILLVNIFLLSLVIEANHLAAVYQMHYPLAGLTFEQILLLLLAATILGWLGARLSVKRQLASIEPYY